MYWELLFHDLQDFHGTGFDTNAAGNALGHRIFGLVHHYLGGAGFYALAAADAELFIDHIHAGLGILRNRAMLTGFHTLATLDAHIGLCTSTLGNDLDTAVILVKLLIESHGAGPDTFQAGHTLGILFD